MGDTFIFVVEIIGTIAFAISGAMVAIKNKLDLLGIIILGCVTACGGGMLRDIILGQIPMLFSDPLYLIIALIVSIVVFLVVMVIKDKHIPLEWLLLISDGLGLGAFVVVGASRTIELGHSSALIVVFMGVLTSVGGGIIRDLLVTNIPFILRKHIYCLAAIIGGLIYYCFYSFGWNINIGSILCIISVVTIRILAATFKWSLPKIDYDCKP